MPRKRGLLRGRKSCSFMPSANELFVIVIYYALLRCESNLDKTEARTIGRFPSWGSLPELDAHSEKKNLHLPARPKKFDN